MTATAHSNSLALLVLAVFASSAPASTLAVNFVNSSAAHLQQEGFDNFVVPEPIFSGEFHAGTADGVGVYVFGSALRSVDRGPIRVYNGELANLSASWIGNDRGWLSERTPGDPFFIRLSGVTAGEHLWTSYHIDNGLGRSANGNINSQMSIEISTDGGMTFTMLDAAYQVLDAEIDPVQTLEPMDPANFAFHTQFVANGVDDVIFRFRNVAWGLDASGTPSVFLDFTVVNGFRLVAARTIDDCSTCPWCCRRPHMADVSSERVTCSKYDQP